MADAKLGNCGFSGGALANYCQSTRAVLELMHKPALCCWVLEADKIIMLLLQMPFDL
jgi:hypothetical protein